MAPNKGGSPLLVFILGGVLIVTTAVGVIMVSGRVPEEIASSRPLDLGAAQVADRLQPSV